MNGVCKITTLPLGRECNKKWFAAKEFEMKIQDFNLNMWFDVCSVTLDCKNNGK